MRNGKRLGRRAARLLRKFGIHKIDPGLSEQELQRVEAEFGFEFADDHRAFLAAGLPLGRSWPDWRRGDRRKLRAQISWPVHGVLLDVEHGGFWADEWGDRPSVEAESLAVARRHLEAAPRMIPVFAHRCIPAGRSTSGHPVLSMHRTDIIVYGSDLHDYIDREFNPTRRIPGPDAEATVPFWSDILKWAEDAVGHDRFFLDI